MSVSQTDPHAVASNVDESTRFAIDPTWYEGVGLSLAEAARFRRCGECRGDSREAPSSWSTEMKAIAECCSRKEGYITSETPLHEAVFRLLLQSENTPLSLRELHDDIKGRWAVSRVPRFLSMETLARLLARGKGLGIRRVEESSG